MHRSILALCSAIGLAVATVSATSAVAEDFWEPKVYVAPDDVTPWRRSDSTDLFRDRPGDRSELRQERVRERGRALEQEFDRLQSRVRPQPELDDWIGPRPEFDPTGRAADREAGQDILRRSTERDLEVGGQELRSLEIQAPNADAIPLLEQQLDRLERPTDLGE